MKSITRRHLLRGIVSAAAAPLVVSSAVLGKDGAVAPSSRITMGAIGMGGQGFGGDLEVFLASPDARVLAVCDVDASRRERAAKRVQAAYKQERPADAYNDFREVLSRDDIDAVLIATPDHWHAVISIQAAQAGKHMYCEKPISLTVAEGRRVTEVMRQAGVVYQSGTQRRSVGHFRQCCELVRGGRIGKLRLIRECLGAGPSIPPQPQQPVPGGFDYDLWLGPAPYAPYTPARCHGSFRWVFDYSGGKITDQGAHFLDIAQWANDTEHTGPTRIEGHATFPREGLYDTPMQYKVVCTYENGVKMEVIHDLIDNDWAVRFEGDDGWLLVARSRLYASRPSLLSPLRPDEVHLYVSRNHQQNFLDSVRTGRPNASPPEIMHRSTTVCHLCNICLRLGRPLRWDPAAERFVNDPEADRMLARTMRAPWRL